MRSSFSPSAVGVTTRIPERGCFWVLRVKERLMYPSAGRGGGRRPVECVPLRVCRFGRPFRILGGYRQQYVEFAVDAVIGYLYRVGGGYGQRRRENPALLYDANGLAVGGIVRRGYDDGSRPALRVGVVGDRDRKLVACRGDRYPFTGCFVGAPPSMSVFRREVTVTSCGAAPCPRRSAKTDSPRWTSPAGWHWPAV